MDWSIKMRYILASGSPRRRELLSKVIPEFEVIPAEGEETCSSKEPSKIVEELSFQKASEIFHKILMGSNEPIVVIGADTVVSYKYRVLGKPAGKQEAVEMVGLLQGRTHSVFTGVTLFFVEDNEPRHVTFSECTRVHVSPMTEDEIWEYADSGEPLDKAGAYGIQGLFGKYISRIDGDYYNVVGLPISRLYRELKANSLL